MAVEAFSKASAPGASLPKTTPSEAIGSQKLAQRRNFAPLLLRCLFMLPESTFFDGFSGPLRVVVVGIPAYVVLIAVLRVSGKRTLSKMNAFDFIVTVALGSTLATVLLSKDVALVEGVTALALLVVLQFVASWSAVRSSRVRAWLKSEPRLLFHKGEFLERAMRQERVTRDEVAAAMRKHGHDAPEAVLSVVLETDGSMSVVER